MASATGRGHLFRAAISTRRRTRMARAWNKSHTLSCVMSLLSRTSSKRPILRKYTGTLRTNHGELLDLFFARLLPSGTGDFGIGPSQLREKQTNPVMIWPYPLTGRCLIEMNFRTWMVIDDFYLSIQYYLLNFNSPIYADCKAFFAPIWDHFFAHFNSRTYTDCKPVIDPVAALELVNFNSRTYTDCKG